MFQLNTTPRVPVCGALLRCIASLFAVSHAVAQSPLPTHLGTQSETYFGEEVAGIGDIDNDGVPDYAVGAPRENNSNGRVRIYSGATHSEMCTIVGSEPFGRLGEEIVGVRDFNADGFRDVLITAAGTFDGIAESGRAFVYSGQWIFNGQGSAIVSTIGGFSTPQDPGLEGDGLGQGAASVGDVDGDGRDDFCVGAPETSGNGYLSLLGGSGLPSFMATIVGSSFQDAFGASVAGIGNAGGTPFDEFVVGAPQTLKGEEGYVRVFTDPGPPLAISAAYTVTGTLPGDRYGAAVDGLGDINGDGWGDFIVGAPQNGNVLGVPVNGAGYAQVCSGADGIILFMVHGDGPGDRFGHSVAGCGDLNGDGVPDFMVGAPGDQSATVIPAPGYVRAYSGADGSVLFTRQGSLPQAAGVSGDEFGASIAAIGDLGGGDGVSELLIGAPRNDFGATDAGMARVFAGVPTQPYVSADKTQISVNTGGDITLQLQSTTAMAGTLYVVLGSADGDTPGQLIDGVLVPLNPDAYFTLTATSSSFPMHGSGVVEVGGLAQSIVHVPPGSPPDLIGTTLYHAVAYLSPANLTVQNSTDAFRTVLTQ